MYTDGVVEAQNDAQQPFGVERLLEVVAPRLGVSAEELQDAILAGLQALTGEASQMDDMTLVVLKRDG